MLIRSCVQYELLKRQGRLGGQGKIYERNLSRQEIESEGVRERI